LINDILLITSSITTTSAFNFSSEKISIHQVLSLDQLSFCDLKLIDDNEDINAFELYSNDRSYILVAESESDKRIWLEELTMAIFCIHSTSGLSRRKLGWCHEIIRGTIHSCSYYGQEVYLRKHIERLKNDGNSSSLSSSLDIADDSGMTALHWSVMNGHYNCVKVLIENGANVDCLNSGLNSPLLIASAFGHKEILFYLLDHGADISMRNLKDYDCLLMLLLYGALSFNVEEIIIAFKIRGIDINKQDISGVTPLHECSARNLPLSIQSLVDAGADVNMKHGRNGLTPLQLACSSAEPDVETIRSLLDKGALPNWKGIDKLTAFDMIIQSNKVPLR
jgi:ankyrin repeat protein